MNSLAVATQLWEPLTSPRSRVRGIAELEPVARLTQPENTSTLNRTPSAGSERGRVSRQTRPRRENDVAPPQRCRWNADYL